MNTAPGSYQSNVGTSTPAAKRSVTLSLADVVDSVCLVQLGSGYLHTSHKNSLSTKRARLDLFKKLKCYFLCLKKRSLARLTWFQSYKTFILVSEDVPR